MIKALQDQKPETSTEVRVIASSQDELKKALETGKLREDLYYRLNVFECLLVPLRHREEDIPVLIQRFLAEFSKQEKLATLSTDAFDFLTHYSWPGNIRELRNVLERSALLSEGREIQFSDLPEKLLRKPPQASGQTKLVTLEEVEKRHILAVLDQEPNLDKAAEILGITKVTLWRRRKEYGLP